MKMGKCMGYFLSLVVTFGAAQQVESSPVQQVDLVIGGVYPDGILVYLNP